MEKVRTAVVGAGKMGEIHARVYSRLKQSNFVAVVDTDIKRAEKLAKKYKCSPITDAKDLLGKVDAVTISAPTIHHLQLAKLFIENNISVLIEKPLAVTVDQARRIVDLAEKHDVIVAVGHSERCNPVVQAMKRLDITPMFIESIRVSPYPFRSADIGVVLDVMIHDIDIILSLAASKVKKVEAIGVSVLGEKEDICNARINFENGCIANVTASRLALKTERKIRIFSKQAYLSLDYLKKTGTVIKAAPNVDITQKVKELSSGGRFDFLKVNWSDLVYREKLQIDDKEPLRVEQEAFLQACINKDLGPEVTAAEGLAAMECAEMILTSIQKHQWEK